MVSLGDCGLQNGDQRIACIDENANVHAITPLWCTAVCTAVAGITAVQDFVRMSHRGHVQHVRRTVGNQSPDTPFECISVEVPASQRESVVEGVVAERVGLIHHVDDEQQATLIRTDHAALETFEVVGTAVVAILPSSDDEVAGIGVAIRAVIRAVLHSVRNLCAVDDAEFRYIRVGDVRECLPHLGGGVLQAVHPGHHDGVFGEPFGCVDCPRSVGLR